MYSISFWRWSALAVAFGLAIPAARAEMITPDSIPNPPSAVDSAYGTQVYASNLVNTQYAGLGLEFPGGSAITHLNGVSVWAPITEAIAIPAHLPLGPTPVGVVDYYVPWAGGKFVSPGSSNPMTVSSLSVETIGNPGFLSMSVYGLNGQSLNITPVIGSIAGAQVWTFTGAGISSFTGGEAVIDPAPDNSTPNPAWGVAELSFTTTQAATPEPSSLVLAGLGALGLAARFGWRRVRTVA